MQVEFPSDIEDINDTDFDILLCLHRNGALWKMELTRSMNRRRGDTLLDLKDSISKQAVGKRVERLHELDYVESSIISLENTRYSQKLIMGYSLTKKGAEMLLEATKLVLRDTLSNKITGKDIPPADLHLDVYSELSGENVESLEEFVSAELDEQV